VIPIPETSAESWAVLAIVIVAALAADLAIFHRRSQEIKLTTALAESAGWIGLALAFNAWVYWIRGPQAGVQFLTGYLVEKSLSADNILLFLVIFKAFGVPARRQHRVLYYGVFGALVLRGIFVYAGVELLRKFHPILYAFGGLLLLASLQMMLAETREKKPERNWMVRLARKLVNVDPNYEGERFWLKRNGKRMATNLLLALVAVESMDIVFAVDSVPAVLAITRDAFIVYSSNAFAILGLRALYFALADTFPRVRYFHQGLAAILAFMGFKMILSDHLPISDLASLAAIGGILAATAAVSWLNPRRPEKAGQ